MHMSFSYIKKRFKYTPTELLFMIIASLLAGFILSFNKWGVEGQIDIGFGIFNLILSIIIIALNLFLSFSVIKYAGIKMGHKISYTFGKFSSLISLFTAFLSNGYVPFFSPGTFKSEIIPRIRHGHIPAGLNLADLSKLTILGTLTNLGIALIAKILMISPAITGNYVINRIMILSLLFAVMTIIPAPEFGGFYIVYASRLVYVFVVALVIAISLFLLFMGAILSVVLSILFAALAFLVYYITVEQKL